MAIRNVRTVGDPILNKRCRPVEEMTPKIKELIQDMLDTMYDLQGAGLAASQVGILKQIVVVDVGEGPVILINPKIVEQSGEQSGDEGCLSLPGKSGTVTRPNEVTVEAFDEDMQPLTLTGSELMARALCHECDHLEGVLYTTLVEGELRDTSAESDEE
jgi:peptide deformylase